MKLSQLIKTLRAAQKQFGDVPVNLMDEESGNWHPLAQVIKLHPYTAPHGFMNRAEPVNAIALTRNGGIADDLVLANLWIARPPRSASATRRGPRSSG